MIFFVNETRIWRTNLKPGTNVSILSQFTGTCGLVLSCPSVARKDPAMKHTLKFRYYT